MRKVKSFLTEVTILVKAYKERRITSLDFAVRVGRLQDLYSNMFDSSMLVNSVCDCIDPNCKENKKTIFHGWTKKEF